MSWVLVLSEESKQNQWVKWKFFIWRIGREEFAVVQAELGLVSIIGEAVYPAQSIVSNDAVNLCLYNVYKRTVFPA